MMFILLDIVLHHHVEHDMSFKKKVTEMSTRLFVLIHVIIFCHSEMLKHLFII